MEALRARPGVVLQALQGPAQEPGAAGAEGCQSRVSGLLHAAGV